MLDFAGFLAFTIALVPTAFEHDPDGCSAVEFSGQGDAIANNIPAVVVAALAAIVFGRRIAPNLEQPPAQPGDGAAKSRRSPTRTTNFSIAGLFLALYVAWYFLLPNLFLVAAHQTASILFLILIGVVIFLNARAALRSPRTADKHYGRIYAIILAITLALVAPLVYLKLFGPDFRTSTFWLEAVGIAGFAIFWTVQTTELRGAVDRDHKDAGDVASPQARRGADAV